MSRSRSGGRKSNYGEEEGSHFGFWWSGMSQQVTRGVWVNKIAWSGHIPFHLSKPFSRSVILIPHTQPAFSQLRQEQEFSILIKLQGLWWDQIPSPGRRQGMHLEAATCSYWCADLKTGKQFPLELVFPKYCNSHLPKQLVLERTYRIGSKAHYSFHYQLMNFPSALLHPFSFSKRLFFFHITFSHLWCWSFDISLVQSVNTTLQTLLKGRLWPWALQQLLLWKSHLQRAA